MDFEDEIRAGNGDIHENSDDEKSATDVRTFARIEDLMEDSLAHPDPLTACLGRHMAAMMECFVYVEKGVREVLTANEGPLYEKRGFQQMTTAYLNYARQIERFAQIIDRRTQSRKSDRRPTPR